MHFTNPETNKGTLTRQHAVALDTPSMVIPQRTDKDDTTAFRILTPANDFEDVENNDENEAKLDVVDNAPLGMNTRQSSISSTDDFVPAPPLPITPPPPKTPVDAPDSILSVYDPLQDDDDMTESETVDVGALSNDYQVKPTFNRSMSAMSEQTELRLPSIPDSYMPNWARQKSDSLDLDLLQFELKTEEQEHFPSSILPDTPQPASLATTITDYEESEVETDYDYDQALDEQLIMLESGDDVPPYPTRFNAPTSAGTSKRNSWNTTSSFAYDQDDTDSIHRGDSNWAENAPSIIHANDYESNHEPEASDPEPEAPIAITPSKVKNIAAMFEQKSPNSSQNSTLERNKTQDVPDASLKPVEKPKLVKRPTAMEILATPSPPKDDGEEDDIDLRKLRRSIVRGARSAGGLKTNPDALLQDPKIKRSTSLTPTELSKKATPSRPRKDRTQSLIMRQDVEATL